MVNIGIGGGVVAPKHSRFSGFQGEAGTIGSLDIRFRSFARTSLSLDLSGGYFPSEAERICVYSDCDTRALAGFAALSLGLEYRQPIARGSAVYLHTSGGAWRGDYSEAASRPTVAKGVTGAAEAGVRVKAIGVGIGYRAFSGAIDPKLGIVTLLARLSVR